MVEFLCYDGFSLHLAGHPPREKLVAGSPNFREQAVNAGHRQGTSNEKDLQEVLGHMQRTNGRWFDPACLQEIEAIVHN